MAVLIRLIVVAAIVWLAVSFIRRALAGKSAPRAAEPPAAMLPCAHCGVHIPEKECIRDGERCFCCEAHRDAWTRRPS